MKEDQFWDIIAKIEGSDEPEEDIREHLEALSIEELIGYQRCFDQLVNQANSWELWGAAYLIEGGCSDDGFMDFRYGLIALGQDIFEAAVEDPDSLAEVDLINEISNELFGYAALEIFSEKTGEEMEFLEQYGGDPEGEDWDFDDEEETQRRLPRLFSIHGM